MARIVGTSRRDVLRGTPQPDTVLGQGGNDDLFGFAGNDVLTGGTGNDVIDGGAGRDRINGSGGVDTVTFASARAGVTMGLVAGATRTGDAAGDTYVSIENIRGSRFADTLAGNSMANRIDGGIGNDTLRGLAGNDALIGGAGLDALDGGDGADVLNGGDGFDYASYVNSSAGVTATLGDTIPMGGAPTGEAIGDTYIAVEGFYGSGLDDILVGNGSNNVFDGIGGGDDFYGGAGTDSVFYGLALPGSTSGVVASLDPTFYGITAAQGDAVGDTFDSIENLYGTNSEDTLVGDANANLIDGRGGNDVIHGGAGADVLAGGSGNDTVTYILSDARVIVSLDPDDPDHPPISGGHAQGDTLSGFEVLVGSNFNDVLLGDLSDNEIGGAGGADIISGNQGEDAMAGGAGADLFVYGNANEGGANEFISGFVLADDRIGILVDAAGFQGVATAGANFDIDQALAGGGATLSAAEFEIAANGIATSAAVRFILDDTSGYLYFDRDGTGGAFSPTLLVGIQSADDLSTFSNANILVFV